MGLSNFPPGVTGMEPQIAGYPERTEIKSCGAEAAITLVPTMMIDQMKRVTDGSIWPVPYDVLPNQVKAMLAYVDDQGLGRDCAFEGSVEVVYGAGVISWTCPECGTEHTEEMDMEPDPDDIRDEQLAREWEEQDQ